jgi:hypothetical protein
VKKVLLLSLLVTNAFAVTGIGEYRYGPDTTENLACELAEEKAKEDAIIKYVGESIEAQIKEECRSEKCVFHRDTFSDFNGYIKSISKKETQKEVFPGYSSCIVTVEAEVTGAKNTISFNVEGKFNVRHEEELTFKIVANKVGKVGMFNYHGNKYYKVQEVKFASQRTEIVLPYDKTKKIVAMVPDGQTQSKELVTFLFSEKDIVFKNEYSSLEMKNLIASIPPMNRKVINRYVNIVK